MMGLLTLLEQEETPEFPLRTRRRHREEAAACKPGREPSQLNVSDLGLGLSSLQNLRNKCLLLKPFSL